MPASYTGSDDKNPKADEQSSPPGPARKTQLKGEPNGARDYEQKKKLTKEKKSQTDKE